MRKKKTKKIVFIVSFILAAVLLLIPLSYMLRPVSDENKEFRNRMIGFYAEEDNSLNIVSMGSSAIFRYVNNIVLWKEYGLTSYNFCSPNQTPYALEYLIDEVDKTQSPDIYIVDVRQFLINGTKEQKDVKLRQMIDNMKYSWNRCKLINKCVPNWSDRISYYFDIIMYHDNWEQLSKDSWEYADNEKESNMKGWSVITAINEMDSVGEIDEVNELPIEEDAETELRYLLDLWSKNNKEVVFVLTPWIIDEENQQKSNYVKRIVEEAGFRYWDGNLYQKEMNFDYSKDFYNDRHVNAVGSEKFAKVFGEYLTQEFQFTKIEKESVVESWEKAEKLYDNKMEAFLKKYRES